MYISFENINWKVPATLLQLFTQWTAHKEKLLFGFISIEIRYPLLFAVLVITILTLHGVWKANNEEKMLVLSLFQTSKWGIGNRGFIRNVTPANETYLTNFFLNFFQLWTNNNKNIVHKETCFNQVTFLLTFFCYFFCLVWILFVIHFSYLLFTSTLHLFSLRNSSKWFGDTFSRPHYLMGHEGNSFLFIKMSSLSRP